MKTEYGHYYIFFNINDFWEKVNFWKSKGRFWIQDSHENYNPEVNEKDFPVVLNVDENFILHSSVSYHKEQYFKDPIFVKLYKKELRKNKLWIIKKNHKKV